MTRTLVLTEEENNYLWHLLDNHKSETTGTEPDAAVLQALLFKVGFLRESAWTAGSANAKLLVYLKDVLGEKETP